MTTTTHRRRFARNIENCGIEDLELFEGGPDLLRFAEDYVAWLENYSIALIYFDDISPLWNIDQRSTQHASQ